MYASVFSSIPKRHFATCETTHSKQIRGERNKDKPLLRRKSDLPADSGTIRALFEHKRTEDFLKTLPDVNKY